LTRRKTVAACILAALLAGCHSGSTAQNGATGGTGGSAQDAADSITRAALNDDYNGVTTNMDATIRGKVARSQLGAMSDKLHKLGDYRGVSLVSSDAAKNEFTYRAQFSKGFANVIVRLDSNGKVAAYHALIPVRK